MRRPSVRGRSRSATHPESRIRPLARELDRVADKLPASPPDMDPPSGGSPLEHLHAWRAATTDIRMAVRTLRAVANDIEGALVRHAERRVASMSSPHAPLKHALRDIEDPEERRIMLKALSSRREAEVVRRIADRSVRWDRPVRHRDGVGADLDERVIELPLAVELINATAGPVLDAGAAVNLASLRPMLAPASHLVHVTQSAAREPALMDGDRFSYFFGDLRALPFKDASFSAAVCISTLEHVGMDNARYGGPTESTPESSLRVVDELRRVVRPHGRIMLSVPFGAPADHGWFRTFGREDVARLVARFAGDAVETRHFAYRGCWVDGEPDPPADDERVLGLSVVLARRGADRSTTQTSA